MYMTFIVPDEYPGNLEKKLTNYIARHAVFGFTDFIIVGHGEYSRTIYRITENICHVLGIFTCCYAEEGKEKEAIDKAHLLFIAPDPSILDLVLYAEKTKKPVDFPRDLEEDAPMEIFH